MSNRRRGWDLGVILLGYELMMNNNIPPVTLVAILAQIGIYMGFIPMLNFDQIRSICIWPAKIWYNNEWFRLIFSPFVHGDDMHLYYNMISFLWKGRRLERKFGAAYFAYLLLTFAFLINIVIVGISILLGDEYMNQCAIGFSGVVFGFKVLCNHYFPNEDSRLFGWIPVPSRYACWLELIVIQILVPNASFVGHLSGIIVGVAYTKGPLKTVMDFIFEAITGSVQERNSSSAERNQRQNRDYGRNFGSGTWGSGARRHEADYSTYTGGLSEEEQLQRAMDESRNQFRFGNEGYSQRTRSTPSAPPYDRLYPDAM